MFVGAHPANHGPHVCRETPMISRRLATFLRMPGYDRTAILYSHLEVMTTTWSDKRFEPVKLTSIAGQELVDVNIEVAHVSASLAGGDRNLNEIAGCMRRYKHIVGSLEYG